MSTISAIRQGWFPSVDTVKERAKSVVSIIAKIAICIPLVGAFVSLCYYKAYVASMPATWRGRRQFKETCLIAAIPVMGPIILGVQYVRQKLIDREIARQIRINNPVIVLPNDAAIRR